MNEFKIGVTFPSMLMKDAERIKSSLENALLSAGCDMLFFCADGEVQKQADQISQMISESCNAIVVWPVGDGVAQVLSQAKDNDIGVLLFLGKNKRLLVGGFFRRRRLPRFRRVAGGIYTRRAGFGQRCGA